MKCARDGMIVRVFKKAYYSITSHRSHHHQRKLKDLVWWTKLWSLKQAVKWYL